MERVCGKEQVGREGVIYGVGGSEAEQVVAKKQCIFCV